jgi:predicted RNA-binding Zn-ribbon protein involved in translation (DUF1610 family)
MMLLECPNCGWTGTEDKLLNQDIYQDGCFLFREHQCPKCYRVIFLNNIKRMTKENNYNDTTRTNQE